MENLNLFEKFNYLINYANYMQISQGHEYSSNILVLVLFATSVIVITISRHFYVILIVHGMHNNPMTPFV